MSHAETIADLITEVINLSSEPIGRERMVGFMELYEFVKDAETGMPKVLLFPDDTLDDDIHISPSTEPEPLTDAAEKSGGVEPSVAEPEVRGNSAFSGAGGEKKRRIYDRLVAFRASRGPGSLQRLAAVEGASVGIDDLVAVYNVKKPLPIKKWRAIDAMLDAFEAAEAEAAAAEDGEEGAANG